MSYDVVFHVDDESCVNLAITNILNFYNAPQSQGAQVVLLANGPGVKAFTKENVPNTLAEAQAKGASIRLCQNAITKFAISPENIAENVSIVPAGIVELIDLQNANFAYIKP